jgi:hypothetical protein
MEGFRLGINAEFLLARFLSDIMRTLCDLRA